ncbi:IL-6 subfamily cytokine M17 [Electrophorus electricus]|uniref:IL-6 subfamily cytokine M17 n=1 Tax=Electrophorus electricus TaxID=8005 RepID=UPI0015D07DBF|nr:IL-6 subfamily cytokine M17 [Electrophorus electricus]
MNGHARNMLWQAHRTQPTAMVLLTLILLAMNEFGNGTAQCIEKSCSKNLHKGIKLSKFVKRATAELIKTYQAAQGNFAEQFCTMSMDSMPSSTLWGSSPAERLQSAYIRLTELLPHVTMVLQQQSDLNPYLGSLLSDLARLVIHGRHLALRLSCILQKLQPNVALPEPAVGPTALLPPQNIFQQKVYGCAVLTRVQKLTLLTARELKSLRGQCTDKT